MNEYFFLGDKNHHKTAFAYTEAETPLAHQLIPGLRTATHLPFDLVLKKVYRHKGVLETSNDLSDLKHEWVDYQPNNLAWPLMSEKMMQVIDRNLTGKESIVWMKAFVKSVHEKKIYFVPRFEKQLDVLDEQQTVFVEGTTHIIKPVFSLIKVRKYSMFHKPRMFWEISSALYINEIVKAEILKEKLSGVSFENVTVV